MGMTVNSMAATDFQRNFAQFNATDRADSTRRVSDDPAGSAIAEQLTAQEQGIAQGTENTQNMNELVNTAEGGLGTISDSLQRVNELTVQAQSGILNDDDRALIQREVDQILEGINETVENTRYNDQNLLDGSFANQNTASGADGTGMQVTISSMSLESLGLSSFSVSDPNALDIISSAIDTVSQQRSDLGAISNTFQHTINSNDITGLNLQAARSGIIDNDIARQSTESSRERALDEYRMNMQRGQAEQQQRVSGILFS